MKKQIEALHQKIQEAIEVKREEGNRHEAEMYKLNLLISDCEMEIAQISADGGGTLCVQCGRYVDLCLCFGNGIWYEGKPLGLDITKRFRERNAEQENGNAQHKKRQ